MKRKIHFILLIILSFFLLFPTPAGAYTVDDIPMVHLQDRMRYVSNPDQILSPATVKEMDAILYEVEQTTGIQVAVFAVKEIEGGSVFDFTQQLGEKYGIGQKGKDNGLIVLLVTGNRKIRIHTGYGLEGVLPDAITKRIQTRHMVPHFKQDDWDSGMLEGIKAIRGYLENYDDASSPQAAQEGFPFELWIFLLVFVGIPLLVWRANRRKRRCPKCHKYTLKETGTQVISSFNGITEEEVTVFCTNCHAHFKYRRRKGTDDDDRHHSSGSGPFWGGFMGGGFMGGHRGSSGGFGGSYGGGSFGGGGSESDF